MADTAAVMDWTQVLGIILGNAAIIIPLFLWTRSESRADIRQLESKLDSKLNSTFHQLDCKFDNKFEKINQDIKGIKDDILELKMDMIEIKTILHLKECCMISNEKSLKKAE